MRVGSTLVQALWSPFEKEFREFEDELRQRHEAVAAEIQLASEMAAAREREAAVEYRKSGSALRAELKQAGRDSTEWRLRQEKQRASKKLRTKIMTSANRCVEAEREKLLGLLSTYDYVAALKRMRRKRHGNTSSWLSNTQTFKDWLEDKRSSALWLSGIGRAFLQFLEIEANACSSWIRQVCCHVSSILERSYQNANSTN